MSGMNNVVKSLLNIRCREGATLNDIASMIRCHKNYNKYNSL